MATNTVTLGSSGPVSSQIGFGCMGITAFYGKAMTNDAAKELVKSVHELNCTHFDTAEVYRSTNPFEPPTAETLFNEGQIGEYLSTAPRDSFMVATKYMPDLHGGKVDRASVEASLDASLKRLNLQYVDLYYCHRMPGTVEEMEAFVASAAELVKAGKIKHIGLSEISGEWLRRAYAVHPIAAVQMEWSLLTRNIEEDLVPVCKELGVGIVAYSPLARNLLAEPPAEPPSDWRATVPRYSAENLQKNRELCAQIKALGEAKGVAPATLSLAWLLHKAKALGVTCVPIPGTTTLAHAKENMAAIGVTLEAADMAKLEELGAAVAGQRGDESYIKRGFESQL